MQGGAALAHPWQVFCARHSATVVISAAFLLLTACSANPDTPGPGVHAKGTHETLAEGAFLPLSVKSGAIVDAEGRQVILRGIEHHSLQDVDHGGREVRPDDYALIASWGFTTMRVAISWSRIEPERGKYDTAYLDQIGDVLDRAKAAGLTVILEWHHDLWGHCAVDPKSTLALSANGAPDWTCPADYTPSTTGYRQLFDHLWNNDAGLMDAYLAAWGKVIARFGSHPALLGYDIFNEPAGTLKQPDFEKQQYLPALQHIIPELRKEGAKGILFFDAPGIRNETLQMYAEPISKLDPDIVYAPHLYSGWTNLYLLKQPPNPDNKKLDFANAAKEAATFGVPWWNGEWGVNNDLPSADQDLELHVGLEDKYLVGSSYWAFEQATPSKGDASISGAQAVLDEHRNVRQDIVNRLSRPYPIAVPGKLDSLSYDFSSHALDVKLEANGSTSPAILYAPKRHLGASICLDVSGPSGWSWDYHADNQRIVIRLPAGTFTLHLAPCAG